MATPTHEVLFDYKGREYDIRHETNIGSITTILSMDAKSPVFVIGVINAYTSLVAMVPAEKLAKVGKYHPLKIDMRGPNGTVEKMKIKVSDTIFWMGITVSQSLDLESYYLQELE